MVVWSVWGKMGTLYKAQVLTFLYGYWPNFLLHKFVIGKTLNFFSFLVCPPAWLTDAHCHVVPSFTLYTHWSVTGYWIFARVASLCPSEFTGAYHSLPCMEYCLNNKYWVKHYYSSWSFWLVRLFQDVQQKNINWLFQDNMKNLLLLTCRKWNSTLIIK